MSLAKKITYNTIGQIISRVGGLFLSLISLSLMTRYLGQTDFGSFTTIFAFLQFFSILTDFGLTLTALQIISEVNEQDENDARIKTSQLFSNIFTFKLFLSIILLNIAAIIIWFFPYASEIKWGVTISSVNFLFLSLAQILQSVFQKNLQMGKPVIADLTTKICFLLGVYSVVAFNWRLNGILVASILVSAINFVLNFYWAQKLIKIKLTIDRKIWLYIFKKSWPLGLGTLFNLIYLRADILILSWYFSQQIVGWYGLAYKFLDVLTVFPGLFIGLLLPYLSAAWTQRDPERFQRWLQAGFDAMSLATLPLVIGTVILAKPIIKLIAGNDFAPAAPILQILIIALGALYLGSIFTHSVLSVDKQKTMLWGFFASALTSLVGYLIFIPRYSYWGAAGVTIYSETLVSLIAFLIIKKTTKQKLNFTVLQKSFLASAIMGLLLYFIKDWNIFITIPLAALLYLAIIILTKGLDKKLIREVIGM